MCDLPRDKAHRNRPIMVAIQRFPPVPVVAFYPDMVGRNRNKWQRAWRSSIDLITLKGNDALYNKDFGMVWTSADACQHLPNIDRLHGQAHLKDTIIPLFKF